MDARDVHQSHDEDEQRQCAVAKAPPLVGEVERFPPQRRDDQHGKSEHDEDEEDRSQKAHSRIEEVPVAAVDRQQHHRMGCHEAERDDAGLPVELQHDVLPDHSRQPRVSRREDRLHAQHRQPDEAQCDAELGPETAVRGLWAGEDDEQRDEHRDDVQRCRGQQLSIAQHEAGPDLAGRTP